MANESDHPDRRDTPYRRVRSWFTDSQLFRWFRPERSTPAAGTNERLSRERFLLKAYVMRLGTWLERNPDALTGLGLDAGQIRLLQFQRALARIPEPDIDQFAKPYTVAVYGRNEQPVHQMALFIPPALPPADRLRLMSPANPDADIFREALLAPVRAFWTRKGGYAGTHPPIVELAGMIGAEPVSPIAFATVPDDPPSRPGIANELGLTGTARLTLTWKTDGDGRLNRISYLGTGEQAGAGMQTFIRVGSLEDGGVFAFNRPGNPDGAHGPLSWVTGK
jgi:hypothetical protein